MTCGILLRGDGFLDCVVRRKVVIESTTFKESILKEEAHQIKKPS